MTVTDLLTLLKKEVEAKGPAQVAREIGYSAAAVSQVANDKYPGDPTNILTRVEEIYGGSTVDCPGLGEEISLAKCADWRRKQFGNTNPLRVRMFQACKICDRRKT